MWALQYYIAMERRVFVEDKRSELEMQCYHLFPERWNQLYQGNQAGDWGEAFGGEEEIPVTDPEDLDRFFEQLAGEQGMTGAEAERMFAGSSPFLGYAEGEGRKV